MSEETSMHLKYRQTVLFFYLIWAIVLDCMNPV